jgi:putative flippase GtrA
MRHDRALPRISPSEPGALTRADGLAFWLAEGRRLLPLFLRFGVVGFAGFLVDLTVVYAAKGWLGLYGAGMLSYFAANGVNFLLNRYWTFRHRPRLKLLRHWLLFFVATLPGLVFNRGAYAALIALLPVCAHHPFLAVIAGSIAGMVANFLMSHRIVFAENRVTLGA